LDLRLRGITESLPVLSFRAQRETHVRSENTNQVVLKMSGRNRGRPPKRSLPLAESEPIVQQELSPAWLDRTLAKFIEDETANVRVLCDYKTTGTPLTLPPYRLFRLQIVDFDSSLFKCYHTYVYICELNQAVHLLQTAIDKTNATIKENSALKKENADLRSQLLQLRLLKTVSQNSSVSSGSIRNEYK
jgi:hypothetical protein